VSLAGVLAAVLLVVAGCVKPELPAGSARGRDLADDVSGAQVRALYVVPSDGEDHHHDTDGTIARSVGAWNDWLFHETGKRVIIDTHGGEPDIGFARLMVSSSDLASQNVAAIVTLDLQLSAFTAAAPNKLFVVYYDGANPGLCGTANSPEGVVGRVAVVYMQSCKSPIGESEVASAGDLAVLHELFHALGAVSYSCPHSSSNLTNIIQTGELVAAGHVTDDPKDLMWYRAMKDTSGVHIDVAHDDYWGSTNCTDVSKSALLTPTEPGAWFPYPS